MSTYVIGDLQGCFESLERLLARIRYAPARDKLWFVGDLVNRGAGSLECLRFAAQSGASVVLGNHDLHLLAVSEGLAAQGKNDTLDAILGAPDREALLLWLRQQELLHIENDVAMVHAGLLPSWSWSTAIQLCKEVERELRGSNFRELLRHMYGNQPDHWLDSLVGYDRLRVVINATTRMRILSTDERIEHRFKAELSTIPPGFQPWFLQPTVRRRKRLIVAGHWSALGLYQSAHFVGLDSGCVWGRQLSALRLEDRRIFQVESAETVRPDGWD